MAADKPVILRLNNGETITLTFSDKPKIVNKGSVIELISKKGTVQIDSNNLRMIVFDPENSVDSPAAADKNYQIVDGFINITGEAPESTIYLYNGGGIQLNTFKTDKNGFVSIPIDGYNETIILKSDSFNFKVLAK